MSTAQDRVKSLREKFLRKELYVIITTNVAPKEKIEELLLAHLEHQIRLEKSGIMFGAGPLAKEDGAGGRGLIIVRAKSFEEAKAIADADPLHQAKLRTYTVERWSLNEGRFTVSVNYSDQTYTVE